MMLQTQHFTFAKHVVFCVSMRVTRAFLMIMASVTPSVYRLLEPSVCISSWFVRHLCEKNGKLKAEVTRLKEVAAGQEKEMGSIKVRRRSRKGSWTFN